MKRKGKTIRNAIIFILLIILTFYIILKDQNIDEIFEIIVSTSSFPSKSRQYSGLDQKLISIKSNLFLVANSRMVSVFPKN